MKNVLKVIAAITAWSVAFTAIMTACAALYDPLMEAWERGFGWIGGKFNRLKAKFKKKDHQIAG